MPNCAFILLYAARHTVEMEREPFAVPLLIYISHISRGGRRVNSVVELRSNIKKPKSRDLISWLSLERFLSWLR
jgi:hypothetical protein